MSRWGSYRVLFPPDYLNASAPDKGSANIRKDIITILIIIINEKVIKIFHYLSFLYMYYPYFIYVKIKEMFKNKSGAKFLQIPGYLQ